MALSLKCRLCGVDGVHENLRHLLLDCGHPKLINARRTYVKSMVARDFTRGNSDLRDYLSDKFKLCGPNAQLRCLVAAGGVDDETASEFAYRFVRGLVGASSPDSPRELCFKKKCDWLNLTRVRVRDRKSGKSGKTGRCRELRARADAESQETNPREESSSSGA